VVTGSGFGDELGETRTAPGCRAHGLGADRSDLAVKIEEIAEPIRVLADCSGGQVRPVRFRWGQRTYVVEAVNGQWIDRAGQGLALHYSVQAGDETYYIHFVSSDVQWWLDRVVLEG